MNRADSATAPGASDRHEFSATEILVGRIIDGEATDADFARFSELARKNTGIWRLFADRQKDRALLAQSVADDLHRASAVDIPGNQSRRRETTMSRALRIATGAVGWAAAIALAVLIGWGVFDRAPRVDVVEYEQVQPHIIERRAGNELDPLLLQSQQLPDGRWEISWMSRRIWTIRTDRFDPGWIQKRDLQPALMDRNAPDS